MITSIGLSHADATLDRRERFALPAEALPATLDRLHAEIGPGAVVTTCNRIEWYVSGAHDPARLIEFVARAGGHSIAETARTFSVRRDDAAVRHLYRVTSGIESMVLGEPEILGQVRAAFSQAVAAGSEDPVISHLFHTAIRTGRRARTETQVGQGALSVSAVAARHAREACGALEMATVLVIGAGEAGQLVARSLAEQQVGHLIFVNRTHARAQSLAAAFGGEALALDGLGQALSRAHVVIAAADAPTPLLSESAVAAAMATREGAPLLLIDIGVPRDIERAAGDLRGVTYHDLDDLQEVAGRHAAARSGEVRAVEAIIEHETDRFVAWWQRLDAAPTIAALAARAEATREAEVARTLLRLDLDPQERARIEAMSRALVKRLLHDPISELRARGDRPAYVQAARSLFRIDDAAPESDVPSAPERDEAR